LADLGYGAELGYISIEELIKNSVEIDLHWKPITLKELKNKKGHIPSKCVFILLITYPNITIFTVKVILC
jgi:hypothetical protein